jgi:hypothetical protein
MGKKRIYDILTWIFSILIILGMILFFYAFSTLNLAFVSILQMAGIILAYVYSIIIIISDFQIEDKTINRVFIIIGSIIFPWILPLIVYLTHIRKRLD